MEKELVTIVNFQIQNVDRGRVSLLINSSVAIRVHSGGRKRARNQFRNGSRVPWILTLTSSLPYAFTERFMQNDLYVPSHFFFLFVR